MITRHETTAIAALVNALVSGKDMNLSSFTDDECAAILNIRHGRRMRKTTSDYMQMYVALIQNGPSRDGYFCWSAIAVPDKPQSSGEFMDAFYTSPENEGNLDPSDFALWEV